MDKTNIELVIFDCDGVLVDSEPLANRIFVELVHEAGFQVDEQTYFEKFYGATLPNRISETSKELNWIPDENFLPQFHHRLSAASELELKAIAGIRELIESLSVPICVASNGSRTEVTQRLKISGLTEHFGGAIFSGLEVPRPKPAPDVYLTAAASFGVAPEHCIVVEDSVTGVTAAVQAGMRVFGHCPHIDPKRLQSAGAIPFFSMTELQEILSSEYQIARSPHQVEG